MQDEQKPPEISLNDLDNAPATTAVTAGDVSVSPDEYAAAFSRVTEENSQLKESLDDAKKRLRTTEILDGLLEPSANKAFRYMFAYTAGVGLIIVMNGFGCFKNPLDSEVLRFLVGSTAATVIGLVGMVLTGVFVGARKN